MATTALLATVAILAIGTEGHAEPVERPTLRVAIRNDAHVGDDIVEEGRRVVRGIYARAAVEITWATDGADVTIILASRSSPETRRRLGDGLGDAFGYAPQSGETRGRIAFVMIDRVTDIGINFGTKRSTILGVGIAHEIGHLLLATAHAASGIMRPLLNWSDFRKVNEGTLTFAKEQVPLVQDAVRRIR
jgi:hypothetical protein